MSSSDRESCDLILEVTGDSAKIGVEQVYGV